MTAAFDPANPPDPRPQAVATRALWDTGATQSVLSTDLVQQLKLAPVGSTKVNHAGGVSTSPTYIVNFMLPNRVGMAGVMVTEFPAFPGFGAIIGMDIISRGDLSLTHVGGKSCMSFRIPSCEEIDFVAQAKASNAHVPGMSKGIGRNDPCHCGKQKADGSGPVKFKNCHGR